MRNRMLPRFLLQLLITIGNNSKSKLQFYALGKPMLPWEEASMIPPFGANPNSVAPRMIYANGILQPVVVNSGVAPIVRPCYIVEGFAPYNILENLDGSHSISYQLQHQSSLPPFTQEEPVIPSSSGSRRGGHWSQRDNAAAQRVSATQGPTVDQHLSTTVRNTRLQKEESPTRNSPAARGQNGAIEDSSLSADSERYSTRNEDGAQASAEAPATKISSSNRSSLGKSSKSHHQLSEESVTDIGSPRTKLPPLIIDKSVDPPVKSSPIDLRQVGDSTKQRRPISSEPEIINKGAPENSQSPALLKPISYASCLTKETKRNTSFLTKLKNDEQSENGLDGHSKTLVSENQPTLEVSLSPKHIAYSKAGSSGKKPCLEPTVDTTDPQGEWKTVERKKSKAKTSSAIIQNPPDENFISENRKEVVPIIGQDKTNNNESAMRPSVLQSKVAHTSQEDQHEEAMSSPQHENPDFKKNFDHSPTIEPKKATQEEDENHQVTDHSVLNNKKKKNPKQKQ